MKFISLDINRGDKDFIPYLVLFSSMIAPLLVEFSAVITNGAGRIFTLVIYSFVFLEFLLLMVKRMKPISFWGYLVLASFIFFNYILFPDNREYIFSTSMLIIYFVYWPVGLSVSHSIKDWGKFFLYIYPFSIIATLIGAYIVFAADESKYSDLFTYMEFSYILLPFVASLYVRLRMKYNNVTMLACILGSLELLIYGARFAVLSFVLLIAFFEILRTSKHNIRKIISILLLVSITTFITQYFNEIISLLAGTETFGSSRTIQKLYTDDLMTSVGRDYIYDKSINYVDHMGMNLLGIFGDRNILGIWPHNFIIEILMQFGWFFGSIIFILIIFLFFKCLLNSFSRNLTLYLIFAFFLKFLVSCSYLQEYSFWYAIFIMLAIRKNKKVNII